MPAPNTDGSGLTQEPGTADTVVEGLNLEESELGSLTLSTEDQLTSTELDSLVNIQDELEQLNTESLGSIIDSNSLVAHEVTVIAEECDEGLSILPHMEEEETNILTDNLSLENEESMPPPDNLDEEELVAETEMQLKKEEEEENEELEENVPCEMKMVVGETISGDQLLPGLSEQMEEAAADQETAASSTANPPSAPVKIAPAVKSYSGPVKPVAITSIRNIKPLNSVPVSVSVSSNNNVSGKNVILSKVVVTGNMKKTITGKGAQTIRVLNPSSQKKIVPSPTKAITLTQARQMGLLSPGKLQQILPNTMAGKKLVVSPKNTVTMVKQPARILPAPAPGKVQAIATSSAVTPKSNTQKVLIRQGGTLKSGTLVTATNASGQVIRIPATQGLASGTVHQIQLQGNKQVQYVRLVSSSNTPSALVSTTTAAGAKTILPVTSVTKPVSVALTVPSSYKMNTQRVLIPAPSSVTKADSTTGSSNTVQGTTVNNIVMFPAQFLQNSSSNSSNFKLETQSSVATTTSAPTSTTSTITTAADSSAVIGGQQIQSSKRTVTTTLEPNGIRPRKPCNCTKSQCLKLYCDCFANGEFCYMCNCVSCFNNLEHEEDRQRAIKSCLERNPNAFRPKIGKSYVGDGERRHNKGCNCKRSGCLKNYCECYEAKIPCSNNCKCVGCQNEEDGRAPRDLNLVSEDKLNQQNVVKNKLSAEIQGISLKSDGSQGPRQPFSLMTQEVVEATCHVLLTQADEADEALVEEAQKHVLEEFGRCLVQIIDCCATRASQQQTTT